MTHCQITSPEQRAKLRLYNQHRNFLLDLPHSQFHMPTYCSPDATEDHCGTAACSAGWTAVQFRHMGWRFAARGTKWFPVLAGHHDPTTSYAKFYGITWDEAFWVTSGFASERLGRGHPLANEVGWAPGYLHVYCVPGYKLTPAMVADRIGRLLREYDPTLLDEVPAPATVQGVSQ